MDLDLDLGFSPALADMFSRRKAEGRDGRILDVTSISRRTNLIILRNLHRALGARHTLEIGLANGGSALVFCQTHKDLWGVGDRQHVAIDPFQRALFINETGLLAIEHAGLAPFLEFREEFSCYALSALCKEKATFEIIYVDGSHLFEDVFVDLYFSIRLLPSGGFLVFDDCRNPHVRKVLDFARRNLSGVLTEISLLHYSEPTFREKVAKLLGESHVRGFVKRGEVSEREWDSGLINF
jgi:predicted O-methyltransferase YrrM